MNKRILLSLLLSLSLLLIVAVAVSAKLPASYSRVRGLYIIYDEPEYELNPPALPVVGGYKRFNWAALEPNNGVYNWASIDSWITREQARGKLVGIGFSFFNEHRGSGSDIGIQIPSWVWGIDSDVRWLNTRRTGEQWYVPNYWNSNFRTYYARFIAAFAQHLADNSTLRDRVAWVSMGVGLSGETQPSSRWVVEEAPDWYYYHDNRGITQDQWVGYVNWCSDTYRGAFNARGMSELPIFVDIGPTYIGGPPEREQFSSHALAVGVGLRHNGLMADREGYIYDQMKNPTYYNSVPTGWETYQAFLPSKGDVFWGLLCGLSKHADLYAFDKPLWETAEYLPLLQFTNRYCGVTASTSPGAWVGLRETQQGNGERGDFTLYMTRKEVSADSVLTPTWNVGSSSGYKFDVPNGTYTVLMRFAEVYYSAANVRVFDIKLEGQTVESNFDIYARAGGKNKAYDLTKTVTVSDGRLDIDFVKKAGYDDDPTIHAIQVTGPGYVARINCGGTAYTDGAHNVWTGDQEYASGSFGYVGGGKYYAGADILNTTDDYLYQTMRIVSPGSPAVGRFARKTLQASGNTRMRFDIDNTFMYNSTFSGATITVTYYMTGTGRWQLKYDSLSGGLERVATPVDSTNPWVEQKNAGVWKQAVFYLPDARFANGQQPGNSDFYLDCMNEGDLTVSFVEVTKGGAPGPSCSIQGSVTLQRPNKPAPDPSWQVPLTVTVGASTQVVNTDPSGNFSVGGLSPGTYDITVKNAHTLSNIRRGYTLVDGVNTINMGELKEGDANGDDRVNSSDFLLLRGSYFKSTGQPGFVDGADFNEDGSVNSSDFLLLRQNYFQNGPLPLSLEQAQAASSATPFAAVGTAAISLDPLSASVAAHNTFDLAVRIDAGAAGAAAADVYLTFDPNELQVVDVIDGEALKVFAKPFDNRAGSVDIGAGTLSAPITGTFTLATVRFRASGRFLPGVAQVGFSLTEPRHTVVKDADDHDLLGAYHGAQVQVGASPYSTFFARVWRP